VWHVHCCCADTTIEKTLQWLGSTFDMVPLSRTVHHTLLCGMHVLLLCADTTIEKTLQRLGSTFDMVPLPAEGSNYIKPASVMFELDGKHLHAWRQLDAS
jgi:hypothetical protein